MLDANLYISYLIAQNHRQKRIIMKKSLLILILSCVSIIAFGQRKSNKYDAEHFNKFPPYTAVVKTYFKENEYTSTNLYTVKFGKKHDGWYVIFKDGKDNFMKGRQIWSARTGDYKNLKTKGLSKGIDTDVSSALNSFARGLEPTFYQQYPVYGYEGYEEDVIAILENEEDLSAELLDALARSYSMKGTQIIMPGQYGGQQKNLKYDNTLNPADFPRKRLKAFIENKDKSIATFKILVEAHSDYQTIVGNISTKYYNEHLAAYYTLRFTGQDEAAKKYLEEDLYQDFTINTAINTLKNCEPNAILFTYGDNDTYPLIYVQDKLNIRSDITVINLSLSNLGRYVNFIKTEYEIKTTLNRSQYQLDNNNHLIIEPKNEKKSLKEFLVEINTEENIYQDENKTRYVPTRSLALMINKEEFTWQLGRDYITKSDLFVLDIIATNHSKTPIYFSLSASPTISDLGLTQYMNITGLAFRFSPKEEISHKLLHNTLLVQFKYSENTDVNWLSSEHMTALNQYFLAFDTLLKHYIKNGDTTKANEVLSYLESVFPIAATNYVRYASDFANHAYKLKNTTQADLYLEKGIQEIHIFFESIEGETSFNFYEQQSINWHLYAADRLDQTARKINIRGLDKIFQAYFLKYGQ
ncbi:MAG: hypothetical protein ACJAUH_002334 [Saprospiraceae bacterium]